MDKLTGADVRGFFVVAAALVVFLVGVLNLVKSWRDLRKPSANAEQWRAETDLRLNRDNKRIAALEEGNKALCHGMLALLSHEINGNSMDKLKHEQENITEYLLNGKYPAK